MEPFFDPSTWNPDPDTPQSCSKEWRHFWTSLFVGFCRCICHLLIPFPKTAFMQKQLFCMFWHFLENTLKNMVSTVTCHNLAFSFSLSTWLLYIFVPFIVFVYCISFHFAFCSFLRFLLRARCPYHDGTCSQMNTCALRCRYVEHVWSIVVLSELQANSNKACHIAYQWDQAGEFHP